MTTAKAGKGRADNAEDQPHADDQTYAGEQPGAVDQSHAGDQSYAGDPETRSPRRPHNDSLELGSLVGAIPSARLHARHVLREWGLDRLCDSAELVVSELVTNAVQATRHAGLHEPICLSLLADDRSVLVVVSDAIPDPPRPCRTDPAEERGRGLMVVENLSDWWDWKPARGGKLVRALVGSH